MRWVEQPNSAPMSYDFSNEDDRLMDPRLSSSKVLGPTDIASRMVGLACNRRLISLRLDITHNSSNNGGGVGELKDGIEAVSGCTESWVESE